MQRRRHSTFSLSNVRQDIARDRRKEAERQLINAESALGRTVFGHVMEGYHREFFCLKRNVWIWYENGTTMRYEVRENGVFKKVNDGEFHKISGEELTHFRAATKAYLELLKANLYK